tara:strand:+ start:2144 stop:2542 length:399 start_codon:yes stop_codon:yes gene_type:complete
MITVFVNGCFDILHRGHIELFQYARSIGDRVIVAVDSDKKVTKDKGLGRPVNNLKDRIYFLSRLKDVDEVLYFDTIEELENLVKKMAPDVMVVGSDWRKKVVVGGQYAKTIKYFERIDGYSTTKIIQDTCNR